ncbi:MAG TPA: hypothetical protein VGL86_00310, partial [Polyangia bacterium]
MRWASSALLLLCACGHHGDENLGLSSGKGTTIDVARLTQPGELERALSLSGHALDGLLGAHHMQASQSLKLELGDRQSVTLDETFDVQADGRGGVQLV